MAKEKKNTSKQSVRKKTKKEINELPLDIIQGEITLSDNVLEQKSDNPTKKNIDDSAPVLINEVTNIQAQQLFEKNISIKASSFSFAKTVYLQIHVGNIYRIFGSGIIAPAKYIVNRAFSDPQTINPSYLVFANNLLREKSDSVALIEVNVRKEENKDFLIQDEVAFFSKPIPISRIKRIYISNERIKKEIIITATLNDGGIIPEKLISSNFPANIGVVKYETLRQDADNSDYSLKLKKYNSILGSLAFLKNYSFLLSNKLESIATLPDHFFFVMQALNNSKEFKIVKNEKIVSFYEQLFVLKNGIESPLLKWLFGRVNEDKNFNDDDVNEFGSILLHSSHAKDKSFVEEAKEILYSLKRNLERKNAIKKITRMGDADKFYLYLFALLRTYGNTNTEDKSISRADMPMFVSNTYGEYVFALLGYFYGYNTLRNYDDKINITDPVFIKNIDLPKRLPIKFELNTLFDYIIIESVYSNVFIANTNTIDTNFIVSESIKKEWPRKPSDVPNEYTYIGDEVYGKFIYQFKKKSLPHELLETINKIPLEVPVISDLGLFCFRNNLPRYYINFGDLLFNKDRLPFFIYFKREDILSVLRNNKVDNKELLFRIEKGILFNELR